jgi:localization factor PodJL
VEQPQPAAQPAPDDMPASAAEAEPAAEPLPPGDDFIAAARRAAQAAATRPSSLRAEFGPATASSRSERGSSVLSRFRGKSSAEVEAAPAAKPDNTSSKRRRLLLAGIVLLAAVSAFAFNVLVKKPAPVAPGTTIETPAQQPQSPGQQGLIQTPADPVITGSLPAADAAALPGLPPPEAGNMALRLAAGSGDAKAQFVVGTRYLEGNGVPQDAAKAAYWYQQAAANGLAPAQYRLATMFERGKGVGQDAPSALSWYEKAAAQGNVKSMHNAAVLIMGGKAGAVDAAKALSLFDSAARHGLRDSQFNLALLYERGFGTKANPQQAYFWYRVAAEQGDTQAAERGAALAKSLSQADRARLDTKVTAWAPESLSESANVLASVNPAWVGGGSSVLASDAAVPQAAGASVDDLVTEAQKLLIRMGFNIGTPDGKMGQRTVTALRMFQLKSGLEVTGELTPEVLDMMRAKAS